MWLPLTPRDSGSSRFRDARAKSGHVPRVSTWAIGARERTSRRGNAPVHGSDLYWRVVVAASPSVFGP